MVTTQPTARRSLQRTLHGLDPSLCERIITLYERLTPLLHLLLRPRDIYERNRAWPGVRPVGRDATRYLSPNESWRARDVIVAYAAQSQEDAEELWSLFYAYCRYGPIGLVDALDDDTELAPREIQEYAQFLRLGKHPRSDAGMYVRELLDAYAVVCGHPALPPFVSRYLFASSRLLDRWFFAEQSHTASQPKVTRRANLNILYPHCRWLFWARPLGVECHISSNDKATLVPWVCGFTDLSTNSVMGLQISVGVPSPVVFGSCLRQAIWHFGATWWPARGVPDAVVIPEKLLAVETLFARSLTFLHCRVIRGNDEGDQELAMASGVAQQLEQHRAMREERFTCSEMNDLMIELAHDGLNTVSTRTTPSAFAEVGMSLPWGHGLSSALLLPFGGKHQVVQGVIHPFGVPYDVGVVGLTDSSIVDVRFDPWDARFIYVIDDKGKVYQAFACAFEHRVSWLDLVTAPHWNSLLEYLQQQNHD